MEASRCTIRSRARPGWARRACATKRSPVMAATCTRSTPTRRSCAAGPWAKTASSHRRASSKGCPAPLPDWPPANRNRAPDADQTRLKPLAPPVRARSGRACRSSRSGGSTARRRKPGPGSRRQDRNRQTAADRQRATRVSHGRPSAEQQGGQRGRPVRLRRFGGQHAPGAGVEPSCAGREPRCAGGASRGLRRRR